jgi:hypothetical protein
VVGARAPIWLLLLLLRLVWLMLLLMWLLLHLARTEDGQQQGSARHACKQKGRTAQPCMFL